MLKLINLTKSLIRCNTLPSATLKPLATTSTLNYIPCNTYASKKKGNKKQKEEANEGENEVEFNWDPAQYFQKADRIKQKFSQELNSLRVGKASPNLLDNLQINCGEEFGGILPLNQVGQVSVKDPQTLLISVFDPKLVTAVERAIQAADLNLNPLIEKGKVRVPIPKLTKETRQETIKLGQKFLELTKTNIRNVRQSGMKELQGGKKLGVDKDSLKKLENEFDGDIKKIVKQVEDLFSNKEKEIQSS